MKFSGYYPPSDIWNQTQPSVPCAIHHIHHTCIACMVEVLAVCLLSSCVPPQRLQRYAINLIDANHRRRSMRSSVSWTCIDVHRGVQHPRLVVHCTTFTNSPIRPCNKQASPQTTFLYNAWYMADILSIFVRRINKKITYIYSSIRYIVHRNEFLKRTMIFNIASIKHICVTDLYVCKAKYVKCKRIRWKVVRMRTSSQKSALYALKRPINLHKDVGIDFGSIYFTQHISLAQACACIRGQEGKFRYDWPIARWTYLLLTTWHANERQVNGNNSFCYGVRVSRVSQTDGVEYRLMQFAVLCYWSSPSIKMIPVIHETSSVSSLTNHLTSGWTVTWHGFYQADPGCDRKLLISTTPWTNISHSSRKNYRPIYTQCKRLNILIGFSQWNGCFWYAVTQLQELQWPIDAVLRQQTAAVYRP